MSFCFCPLRSGSSGNALLVQAGSVRVLVDAGLTGRALSESLAQLSATPDSLSAILISHEHSDHICGVGVISRRHDLPVYATEKTWAAMDTKKSIGQIAPKNRRLLCANEDLYIHDLCVSPFSIPHDAADPVGFSILYGGKKLCIATDIGHLSDSWMHALTGANLLLLEANHDLDMMARSTRYPAVLKRRILGRRGHLSNADSGKAISMLVESGLSHVILGHLSAETNTPAIAEQTVCAALLSCGITPHKDVRVDIAHRDRIGNLYTL